MVAAPADLETPQTQTTRREALVQARGPAIPPAAATQPTPAARTATKSVCKASPRRTALAPKADRSPPAYDPRDISENQERNKLPKLTLMEEILLLGLKDKQVGLGGYAGLPGKTSF